ncbi:DEAD/DEAH box helicase family protein [bacterium]|nr:DEAD/DEAH box helicase family protein [bacterium]
MGSRRMHLKFDANQDFQLQAINAVAGLFDGQARANASLTFALGAGFAAVPNQLALDEEALLTNLRKVQSESSIPPDNTLETIEQDIETVGGMRQARFPNFSVEMETGTGKTYVYVRTALELYRRYGFRKFIVVVPSVAIREGVLKTLEVTRTHLSELYDNAPYRYYVYDSERLSQIRQFALSDGVEIMVMTIDSFNKASNVIRSDRDQLQGETPIHLVQATRPILILDEPQNMESELRVKALSLLAPLCALRYSATHRNPYNLVYRLTPFEAYRQGLVKRIEVASVVKEHDANKPYVRLDGIRAAKHTLTARIALHKLLKDGTVKEEVVTVKPGDSLEKKASRPEYEGFVVEEINPLDGKVVFCDGTEIYQGEAKGADKEAIFEAQIRYTIETHFLRQARLTGQGIKVLSLLFIDRVDNYAREDGLIRLLFNKAFGELKAKHAEWRDKDARTVQAAYFAQKRRRGGQVDVLDSVSGESKEDAAAYDLIMRDKERLLSFDEPVAFIFSHSALREGWDNPNVFQICTLNQSASEVKKRQEIGRGVRLPVDQSGERVRDEKVNVLTVVANESYEKYVATLQSEIEAEYGAEGLPPKPANARKRTTARLRKEYMLKPEFRELWGRIKQRTRYAVRIDGARLVKDALSDIDREPIQPPRVTITKAVVQASTDDMFTALQSSGAKTVMDLSGRYALPNLVDVMAHMMAHTTPPMRVSRGTLLELFRRTTNQTAAMANPHEFAAVAVRVLKDKLAEHLVNGIEYERINEWYEMTQFEAEIESWEDYLVPSRRPDGTDGASLYDQVPWQSEIEKAFAEALERRDDVKLYVKLPGWFKVDTPIGPYNPDWAIVMEDRDEHGTPSGKPLLYLVRETKDTAWKASLRPEERRKIHCGERHFKDTLGVDYAVVSAAAELP